MDAIKDEVAATVDNLDQIGESARLVKLCWRVERYWRYHGPWTLADRALARAEAYIRTLSDDAALSEMLYARAWILQQRGEWDEALRLSEEKAVLDARRAAPLGRALALKQAGAMLIQRGELEAARSRLRTALRLEEQHGAGERELGMTLAEMGNLELLSGNLDTVLGYFRRSLPIFNRIGDEQERGATLHAMAVAHAAIGESCEALALVDEAIDINRRLHLHAAVAASLCVKGGSHADLGEDAEAEQCLQESLALCRGLGDTLWMAENLYQLDELRVQHDQIAEARSLLAEALPLFEQLRQRNRTDICHRLLAELGPSPPPS